ncbi:MAG: type II toxin-antitoxin system PemK/MazF family toxin [Mesorhizobium sp.]|nr:type II toxin-antitoxin system PemK/MazF family toxin [Mesorhizobium sp.]MCO5162884.1 type II toxin-antitoxin system PemK/MazF family toxin [Mesorhizobium sp.]
MICERYDVVVVPFPFTEIPVRKRRPVLVFSGSRFNHDNEHSLVAMITTAKGTSWPSDVAIDDLQSAGLLHPCVMRLRFQTMPNSLIVRKLGTLNSADAVRCADALSGMLN